MDFVLPIRCGRGGGWSAPQSGWTVWRVDNTHGRPSTDVRLACLFEAAMGRSPYGAAAACLDGRTLAEIERVITPVAIGPWRWLGPTRFYARGGAVMYSMANGDDIYSVWIGAKTEGPLQFLKSLVADDVWEHRAF